MRAIAKQSRTICIPFFDYYWIATASPREDKLFAPCLGELSSVARLRGCRNNLVIASNSEAIQDYINPFLITTGSPRLSHSLAMTKAFSRSLIALLIARNFFDLITNLSRFFKFPCLDGFIKLDFEILENNFFFSFSCSLEFFYFTSCKRSKILI